MKREISITIFALFFLFTSACASTKSSVVASSSMVIDSSSSTASSSMGSSASSSEEELTETEKIINNMTLREQVEQLFVLGLKSYGEDTEAAKLFFAAVNPGGYVFFAQNISTVEGTKALADAATKQAKIAPFIGIDEEGGIISRLTAGGLPGYVNQPTAYDIGATRDAENAYQAGAAIGKVLKTIGVNVDFAPDADVLTNPNNTVIGSRSFGSDAALVAKMVSAYQKGLHDYGIMSAPKHFPGHGGTAGDSHDGFVSVDYDVAHFAAVEYPPFVQAISEGAQFILVGHITAPAADSSGLPASLSPYFMTDILRNELGFEGIIITDAMDMGAIANNYTAGEAAVLAIIAGVDMIMMPKDYNAAVQGVLDALASGQITSARIQESLTRILDAKSKAGLLG